MRQRYDDADENPQAMGEALVEPGEYSAQRLSRRKRRKAQKYEEEMATWKTTCDEFSRLLSVAQSGEGYDTTDVILVPGETVFLRVTDARIAGSLREPGKWQGHSSGVSVPLPFIRLGLGGARGKYTAGRVRQVVTDQGTLFVTSRRLVFLGGRAAFDCSTERILRVKVEAGELRLDISGSNLPLKLWFTSVDTWQLRFALDIATALSAKQRRKVERRIRAYLELLEGSPPSPPACLSQSETGRV